ncbi:hypothetical protein NE237_011522 [Protea cynaroides]|uniref:Cytochrome P450 n=1 Tax=Protea cynaroides TaxID=273540 RepID=A0A9Q0JVX5_9MAGN|nr:hypothetical protein NE237_011522 [Protea cynaroides]
MQMMEEMVKSVVEISEGGEAVDVGRIAFGTILNLLSNTFFSFDMIDQKSKRVEEIKEIIWRIMDLAGKPNVADYFPLLRSFDPQGIRREIKVCYDRLHSLLEDIIHARVQRRASGSARSGDFLDVLLDYSHEHGDDFSLRDIKLLLSALFIGGTDTTTTTLEWAMCKLLQPDLNVTCRASEALRNNRCRSDIKDRISLVFYAYKAVLKEEETLLTGPIRTVFLPERFLGSEIDFTGSIFCFIPFGAGRRMYPAQPLAERMSGDDVGYLLNRFHWKLPKGMTPEEMDMKDKLGIQLHKATPLIAVPFVIVDGE